MRVVTSWHIANANRQEKAIMMICEAVDHLRTYESGSVWILSRRESEAQWRRCVAAELELNTQLEKGNAMVAEALKKEAESRGLFGSSKAAAEASNLKQRGTAAIMAAVSQLDAVRTDVVTMRAKVEGIEDMRASVAKAVIHLFAAHPDLTISQLSSTLQSNSYTFYALHRDHHKISLAFANLELASKLAHRYHTLGFGDKVDLNAVQDLMFAHQILTDVKILWPRLVERLSVPAVDFGAFPRPSSDRMKLIKFYISELQRVLGLERDAHLVKLKRVHFDLSLISGQLHRAYFQTLQDRLDRAGISRLPGSYEEGFQAVLVRDLERIDDMVSLKVIACAAEEVWVAATGLQPETDNGVGPRPVTMIDRTPEPASRLPDAFTMMDLSERSSTPGRMAYSSTSNSIPEANLL
ncbi:hypothetical protein BC830DRAFT_1092695, partial [Chytriomyces sp. MP71]